MSVEILSAEGRYEVVFRKGGAGDRLLLLLDAVLGILLVVTPVLLMPLETAGSVVGIVLLLAFLFAVALKLVAEASRMRHIVSSLHVASGELEVRAGRGILARTTALGAVEVDHLLLAREEGGGGRHRLSVVPRLSPPLTLIRDEPDEENARDAALTLSRGMDVELADRRYDVTLRPEGAGPEAPARVAVFEEEPRVLFVWDYRDRLRPGPSLVALGLLVFFAFGPATLMRPRVPVVLAASAVLLLLALGLLAHLLRTLTVRRVTIRGDAVRLERSLGGVPLLSRLARLTELKAILVLRRGPFASVVLRLENRKTALSLPFEDPRVAGWISGRIHRAAHDVARAEGRETT